MFVPLLISSLSIVKPPIVPSFAVIVPVMVTSPSVVVVKLPAPIFKVPSDFRKNLDELISILPSEPLT